VGQVVRRADPRRGLPFVGVGQQLRRHVIARSRRQPGLRAVTAGHADHVGAALDGALGELQQVVANDLTRAAEPSIRI
jgi:hypothetical protein